MSVEAEEAQHKKARYGERSEEVQLLVEILEELRAIRTEMRRANDWLESIKESVR